MMSEVWYLGYYTVSPAPQCGHDNCNPTAGCPSGCKLTVTCPDGMARNPVLARHYTCVDGTWAGPKIGDYTTDPCLMECFVCGCLMKSLLYWQEVMLPLSIGYDWTPIGDSHENVWQPGAAMVALCTVFNINVYDGSGVFICDMQRGWLPNAGLGLMNLSNGTAPLCALPLGNSYAKFEIMSELEE